MVTQYSQLQRRKFALATMAGIIGLLVAGTVWIHRVAAQQPAASQPVVTDANKAKLDQLSADLKTRRRTLLDGRLELVKASLVWPVDDAAVAAKLNAVVDAEKNFALLQADATAAGVKGQPDRGERTNDIPNLSSAQAAALTEMAGALQIPSKAVSSARGRLTLATIAEPRDDAAVKSAVDAMTAAELTLTKARTEAFGKIQASPNKLAADQVNALAAMGGALKLGGFHEPKPIDFNDHEGYVSLFDGKTLKGWDGNPKIWRVEDGNIIGESTPANPSGNTYLVYRDDQAKDFTLKFEIKIDNDGGSGMQYRSKTNIPWLNPIAPGVNANPDWMMTGPQADFWPTQIYSGQFYSENTPMRIIAWRGQVVEANGISSRRLMGNIGDRKELGKFENKHDWNQYTVIARGGTFIHIMNGQLMSVLVDDDPTSSNNQSGFIGIEIESITKLYVRNVWLKKLS